MSDDVAEWDDPEQSADYLEDDGVLDGGDTLESDDLSEDPLDTGISPQERHPNSERYGVTLRESRTGESLDERLSEEEPEEDGELLASEPRTGRLVTVDEGAHEARDADYLARDVGVDGGASSSEEAAMHVIGEDDEFEFGDAEEDLSSLAAFKDVAIDDAEVDKVKVDDAEEFAVAEDEDDEEW
ncbi:MAG: DUF5709 domain-containing protein [Actinocrinis sp.]